MRRLSAIALLVLLPSLRGGGAAATADGPGAPDRIHVPDGSRAEDEDLRRRFGCVRIKTSKTSIYIGSVTLAVDSLILGAGGYGARYDATVFPYFFYNESGKFAINISDEQLRSVARGVPIDVAGHAVASDGAERTVTGRVTPLDATHGRIKVRIFVSRRIGLVFDTTYEVAPSGQPGAGSGS